MQKNNFGHTNLAGKKHNKKAVQEAAQQRLALDKGQKIDNKSQKVNENMLDLDKENVDQLNQEEEKSFKCIFCGETVGKPNWQTHIDTNHTDKISQEKVGNLTTVPEANTSVQEAAQKRLRSLKMIEPGNSMTAQVGSVVKVTPEDISILKREIKKRTIETVENISSQSGPHFLC